MEQRQYSLTEKAAVLTIAILTFEVTMMSPALGVIAKAFPNVRPDMIKQVVALPMLLTVPLALVSGHIERIIGTRKLLLCAMVLQFCGILPALGIHDFNFILISRVFFGIGLGLLIPMSASVIHKLFDGKERSRMLGYRSSIQAVVGVVFQMVGGFLAAYGWKYAFLEMLVQIPLFVLIYYKLPQPEMKREKEAVTFRDSIKPMTLLISGGNIIYNVLWFSFITNMAMMMLYVKVGQSVRAGAVLSFETGASFIAGLAYGHVIARVFKRYSIVLALLLEGVGFIVLLAGHTFAVYSIGAAIFGLGFATYTPEALFRVMSTVKTEHASVAVGVFLASQGLGQFISPIVLTPIARAFGNSSPVGPWYVSTVGLLVAAVLLTLIIAVTKPKAVSVTPSRAAAEAR
jgi:MFS family permease